MKEDVMEKIPKVERRTLAGNRYRMGSEADLSGETVCLQAENAEEEEED